MCKKKPVHVIMYINESNISDKYLQTKLSVCAFDLIYMTVWLRYSWMSSEVPESQTAFVPSQRLTRWQFKWFSSNETLAGTQYCLHTDCSRGCYWLSDPCHTRVTDSIKYSGSSETLGEYDMFKVWAASDSFWSSVQECVPLPGVQSCSYINLALVMVIAA